MRRRTLSASIALMGMFAAGSAMAAGAETDGYRTEVTDGPVTLSVSVDKVSAQVADPIQLVVEVKAPRGARVELPQLLPVLGEFETGKLQILRDLPSREDADVRNWVLRATLETLKTGNLVVPPLEVAVAADGDGGMFRTLRSKPIDILITSVLENRADPTKLRDVKATVDLDVPEQPSSVGWLAWTAAAVMVGSAALALGALLIARRNRGPSPAEWALSQIEDLRQLQRDHSAESEVIYNALVDVVRKYFEYEFRVPASSWTSQELLAEAAGMAGLDGSARKRLASLISIADEIKFAQFGIEEHQVRQTFADATAFVQECSQHREMLERTAT